MVAFNNSFTTNAIGNQNYLNAITAAENFLSSTFTNAITINVTWNIAAQGQNGTLASNSFGLVEGISYTALKNALITHGSPAVNFPGSDPSGGAGWSLPVAYARMLGLFSSSGTDDTVTLNSSYNWAYNGDVTAVLIHELTEGGMGRIGELGKNTDNQGHTLWSTLDLFRYNNSHAHDYTDGQDGLPTHFSLDGGATLSSLTYNNQYSGGTRVNNGDTADFTQLDIFGTGSPGTALTFSSTDYNVMAALGWTRAAQNHAPVVTASDHLLEINHWSNIASWTSYSDADGNPSVQYQFWYGDTAPGADKYWSAAWGIQMPYNTYTLSDNNAWAGGATDVGTDTMWVRASDGQTWGNWASFTITTGPQDRSDFNNDAHNDILWRSDAGQIYAWEMSGFATTSEGGISHAALTSDWHIEGIGDFNHDLHSDILWRNDNGGVYVWEMNGLQVSAEGGISHAAVTNDWHIAGVGDFDHDSNSDILWRNENGGIYIWEMNGLQVKTEGGVAHPAVGNDWHIQGIGDFDGDLKSDVLWRNDNGAVYIWEMNGFGVKAEGPVAHAAVPNQWQIEGLGDFDHDGKSDVLWRNDNGQVYIWEMNGLQVKAEGTVAHAAVTSDWHVQSIADVDGDGKSDIIWRNDNGAVYIWEMNGLQIKAEGSATHSAVGNDWHITA